MSIKLKTVALPSITMCKKTVLYVLWRNTATNGWPGAKCALTTRSHTPRNTLTEGKFTLTDQVLAEYFVVSCPKYKHLQIQNRLSSFETVLKNIGTIFFVETNQYFLNVPKKIANT